MRDASDVILLALLCFQVKHFLCDFVLQTEYQLQNKSIYGHRAGILHAGLHVVGSIPSLLILSAPPGAIGVCLLGEFIIHYHADWLKARFDARRGEEGKDTVYWIAFGMDQFIHQVTYLGMVFVVHAWV